MSATAGWMDPLTLSRPVHNLLSRRGPRARLQILIYHRVLEHPDPLQPGEPTVDDFRQQMALVARHFNVLPLEAAVDALENGSLPERALCITFDDGYADNVTLALPVLREFGLTATVFVAPGYLDGGIMFNDAVRCCLEQTAQPRLELESLGLPNLAIESTEQRLESLGILLKAMKYLPFEERQAKTAGLADITGAELPTDLMMSSELLRDGANNGLDIGAHTINHPILKTLDSASSSGEITSSRDMLTELVGREITLFAYPNGVPGTDYSMRDVELVKSSGFKAAVSTRHGYSTANTDRFQLRRFTPWDKHPTMFFARLLRNYTTP